MNSSNKILLGFSLLPVLQALGVVFGDIGTSPLYVLTAMLGTDKNFYTAPHIMGAIGIIFWVLVIVVSAFYCGIVLKINQHGDGGITVLHSLSKKWSDRWLARLGIAGVLADGQITPAISVLSAWWGLLAVQGYVGLTTILQGYAVNHGWLVNAGNEILIEAQRVEVGKVVAIALTIVSLFALASIQSKGSSKIGTFFGPVMLVWLFMLAWGGAPQVMQHRDILWAPLRVDCIWSMITHDLPWWTSFTVLGCTALASLAAFGAALLAATGGEALYADMGHFGRCPIVIAWVLVIAGLLVNYFGQGALLIYGGYTEVPFFALYQTDQSILTFMVGLAVAATLIASQALVTGCFSLVVQAINLRLVPRVKVIFTSEVNAAHVYVPLVNIFLLIGAVGFVLIFRDPDAMTYSYGMAVGTTMSITYLLVRRIHKDAGKKNIWFIDLCGIFIFALTFGAYSKLFESLLGLIPLCNMAVFMFVMTIWGTGQRTILEEERLSDTPTFEEFIKNFGAPPIVSPTARVFMCAGPTGWKDKVPAAFVQYLREEGTCPNISVFVHVDSINRAHVPAGCEVASVDIYGIDGELKRSSSVTLHDLPPAPIPLQQLKKWAMESIRRAPYGIQKALSYEQVLSMFEGDSEAHPEQYINLGGEQQVVLVRVQQGRQDPPFMVPVLSYLGITPFNMPSQMRMRNDIPAKVVVNRMHLIVDDQTVWYTKLWVSTFRWIRNRVQTWPEHLGVPTSATMFVTLRVDLQGGLGGDPVRVIIWSHLTGIALCISGRFSGFLHHFVAKKSLSKKQQTEIVLGVEGTAEQSDGEVAGMYC